MNPNEWHVEYSLMADAFNVWVMQRSEDGGRRHVTAVFTLHETTPRHQLFDGGPTLQLSESEAQQLMNGLWHAGVRPRDGAGSLAHVDATKAHLEDMRRLVFKGSTPSEDAGR